MTPFGLRKRLKGLVGRLAGGADADPRFLLRITLPNGQEAQVEAEARYTLVMASQSLETPIATGCPDGQCGGCAVDVLVDAGFSAPTDAERKLLDQKHPGQPNVRLACHARVTGGGGHIRARQVWSMETVKGE